MVNWIGDEFKRSHNEEFVDLLEELADGLFDRINNIINGNHNEIELLYFVDYVVCDLFRGTNLSNAVYDEIVNEFLKRHLLVKTLNKVKVMYYKSESQPYMDKLSKESDNRINEYKTQYPLLNSILTGDSEAILKLIKNASNHLFEKRNNDFVKEMYTILVDFQLTQIKRQENLLDHILKRPAKSRKRKYGI